MNPKIHFCNSFQLPSVVCDFDKQKGQLPIYLLEYSSQFALFQGINCFESSFSLYMSPEYFHSTPKY